MANVVATTVNRESASKHPPDVHELEVIVNVTNADDDTLNGEHKVRFNWHPEEVTFHSHVLPSPLEVLVTYADYALFEEVLEAAAGYLVDDGFELSVDEW